MGQDRPAQAGDHGRQPGPIAIGKTTGNVLRNDRNGVLGIPLDHQVLDARHCIDFDYVPIEGGTFLLPVRAQFVCHPSFPDLHKYHLS